MVNIKSRPFYLTTGASGNYFCEFGDKNGNVSFHSQRSGTGRKWKSSQNSGTGREIKFEPQGRANKKIQILKSLKISKFTFDYHVKWQIQEREKNEKKIQTNYSGGKSNLIWRGHTKTKKIRDNNGLFVAGRK